MSTRAEHLIRLRADMQTIVEGALLADEIDVGISFADERFIVLIVHPHDGHGKEHERAIPGWLATMGRFKDLHIVCQVTP